MTELRYRDVIFTPPPTPNGGLHVGHVAGPYLRADLNRRLLVLLGVPAQHSSHIDNYQTYVAKKARELGREADEFRRAMIDRIEQDYCRFDIEFDLRIDNTTGAYRRYLEGCLAELFGNERAFSRAEFVGSDDRYSAVESFVTGICPACFQHAFANVCENCGAPLDVVSLIKPTEELFGGATFREIAPGAVPTALRISEADVEWVRELHTPLAIDNRFIPALTSNLSGHAITLTLRSDYGFAVAEGRVVNPWVEIFFAHAYSLGRLVGVPEECTLGQLRDELARHPELRVSYYFGVDNSYYYAVLFPLLARMMDLPQMLPAALKANRFLSLNGAKVSSSKNNVIWACDIASTHAAADLRGALAASCPEFAELDFRETMLAERSTWRSATAKSRAVFDDPQTEMGKRFRAMLFELAEPARFSVADLLNRMDRAMVFANSSRAENRESEELAQMVAFVNGELKI